MATINERVLALEADNEVFANRLIELENMIQSSVNPIYPEPEANVKVKLVGGLIPKKANIDKGDGREDSGYDIFTTERFSIEAGKVCTVDTKIKLVIPPGYEGQIRPKSGLSKEGVLVLVGNAEECSAILGTVDNPYTGNLGVTIYNTMDRIKVYNAGDKIAQIVFVKLAKTTLDLMEEGEELPITDRGDKGFGSNITNN